MADYDNTNRGALFAAKERKTDKHPNYTGSINVDGREYFLSAWLKEAKSGQKYMSLSVQPKRDMAATNQGGNAAVQGGDGPDIGDIPF